MTTQPRYLNLTELARISTMWEVFRAYERLCLRNGVQWAGVGGKMLEMLALIGEAGRANTDDAIRSALFTMGEDVAFYSWPNDHVAAARIWDFATRRAHGTWQATAADWPALKTPRLQPWDVCETRAFD